MLATPSLDLVLDTHSRFATPHSSNQTQHKHGDKFMQHTHAMPSAMRNERCTHARTRPTDKKTQKRQQTQHGHTQALPPSIQKMRRRACVQATFMIVARPNKAAWICMFTTITNSTSRRTPTVGAMDARKVCYVYEAPNRNLGRLSMAARAISNNATLDRSPFTCRAQEVRQRASSTHMRTSRALLPPPRAACPTRRRCFPPW